MRKFLQAFLAAAAAGGLLFFFGVWQSSRRAIPPGEEGSRAGELARKIEKAVRADEWQKIETLTFEAPASGRSYFYEKASARLDVVFSRDGRTYRLRIPARNPWELDPAGFQAAVDGSPVVGADKDRIASEEIPGIRDELWLFFPFHGLSGMPGLKFVGGQALLFERKEATFLLVTDRNALPTHWKVWQKGAFVQGREISFDDWTAGPGPRFSLRREDKTGSISFEKVRVNSN